jgi:hypothetical protein
MPVSRDDGGEAAPLTWWERLKYAVVKPDDDAGQAKEVRADRPVEEVQEAIARADDKERAIGLIAAPLAAVVGLIVSSASLDYARSHGQSLGEIDALTYVLLGLAVFILAASWMRKRLFQGIALALFGLAIFNLHYWGFGFPFLMAGAWYLVRAYRLQQELKRAEAAEPAAPRRGNGSSRGASPRPRPSKRYTPKA